MGTTQISGLETKFDPLNSNQYSNVVLREDLSWSKQETQMMQREIEDCDRKRLDVIQNVTGANRWKMNRLARTMICAPNRETSIKSDI